MENAAVALLLVFGFMLSFAMALVLERFLLAGIVRAVAIRTALPAQEESD